VSGTQAPSPGEAIAFIRRGAVWCEVAKLGDPMVRIRLGGLLRTRWMSALCNRLAESRISIEHTHARLAHDESWIAELHIFPMEGAADPLKLPYIELMETDDAISSAAAGPDTGPAFRLDSYRLIESRDYGGTLMLTLEAADTLGLLGALFASLAELGLFPVEVHIETRDSRAYDCLWLGALGGAPPPASAKEALDQLLTRSVSTTDSRI